MLPIFILHSLFLILLHWLSNNLLLFTFDLKLNFVLVFFAVCKILLRVRRFGFSLKKSICIDYNSPFFAHFILNTASDWRKLEIHIFALKYYIVLKYLRLPYKVIAMVKKNNIADHFTCVPVLGFVLVSHSNIFHGFIGIWKQSQSKQNKKPNNVTNYGILLVVFEVGFAQVVLIVIQFKMVKKSNKKNLCMNESQLRIYVPNLGCN